jgi:hypothetical protein
VHSLFGVLCCLHSHRSRITARYRISVLNSPEDLATEHEHIVWIHSRSCIVSVPMCQAARNLLSCPSSLSACQFG